MPPPAPTPAPIAAPRPPPANPPTRAPIAAPVAILATSFPYDVPPIKLAVVVWMLAALVWRARPSPAWAAVMGLAAGVAMLVRAELGVLIIAGVVAAWWLGGDRRWLMAVLAAAGGLLVLAPWVAFNVGRFDRTVILSTNDGTTLRASNCDAAYEGRAIGSAVIKCLVIDPEVVGMEIGRARRRRARAYHRCQERPIRREDVLCGRRGERARGDVVVPIGI